MNVTRTAGAPSRASILILTLLLLGGCWVGDSSSEPERDAISARWLRPGLVDDSGNRFTVQEPGLKNGRTLDATDFGADPAPGSKDDAAAVRAAIGQADVGDTVVLPAGTYDLNSVDPDDPTTNVTLRSGVDVRGMGSAVTVLRSSFDGVGDSAVLRGDAVQDVAVSALSITSTYTGRLATDPEDDDAGGGPMYGVQIGEQRNRGSSQVLIEDVGVSRFQRHGITVKASQQVTVRRCRVGEATSVGAGGSGYGIAVEGRSDQRNPDARNDSRHNVVTGNLLDGDHLRHGILLQFPTHNNLIADNIVNGSILDAIDVHGEGEYLNEIRGNTVTGSRRAAIALGNSGGSNHHHGASGEYNWVHDNVLRDNQEGVVAILGTPQTLIESNRIERGDNSISGIRLDDAPESVVRRNIVSGPSGDFRPVRVTGNDDGVTLEDNEFRAGR